MKCPRCQHESRLGGKFCQECGIPAGRRQGVAQARTGLGLTLARKLVELHGGQIWVQSQVSQGSMFTFTLPVRPESTSSSG